MNIFAHTAMIERGVKVAHVKSQIFDLGSVLLVLSTKTRLVLSGLEYEI